MSSVNVKFRKCCSLSRLHQFRLFTLYMVVSGEMQYTMYYQKR